MIRLLLPLALTAWCSGPTPPEPVTLSPGEVGVVVTNTAGDTAMAHGVADAGPGLVRLSHYMLERGFRHRMRDDLDAALDAGLEVYLDLQWWPPRETFDVFEWAGLVLQAVQDFPEVTHFAIGNEPNVERFWPYGRGAYLQAFGSAAHIIRDHGRKVVGPELATTGEWREWLDWFLEEAEPDVLSIHWYGSPEGLARAVAELPGTQPVWVTETAPTRWQGRAQHMREISRAQSRQSRWERTYWYHWYAEPEHPAMVIRGTELERTLREIVR